MTKADAIRQAMKMVADPHRTTITDLFAIVKREFGEQIGSLEYKSFYSQANQVRHVLLKWSAGSVITKQTIINWEKAHGNAFAAAEKNEPPAVVKSPIITLHHMQLGAAFAREVGGLDRAGRILKELSIIKGLEL